MIGDIFLKHQVGDSGWKKDVSVHKQVSSSKIHEKYQSKILQWQSFWKGHKEIFQIHFRLMYLIVLHWCMSHWAQLSVPRVGLIAQKFWDIEVKRVFAFFLNRVSVMMNCYKSSLRTGAWQCPHNQVVVKGIALTRSPRQGFYVGKKGHKSKILIRVRIVEAH